MCFKIKEEARKQSGRPALFLPRHYVYTIRKTLTVLEQQRERIHNLTTPSTPISLKSTSIGDLQAIPNVAQLNLASLKHFKSTAPPFFLGGNLPLIHTFPITINPPTISARMRIAHVQLNFVSVVFKTRGKTIPPTLDPTKVIPDAIPLFLSNPEHISQARLEF
jgi:hypothetical protein